MKNRLLLLMLALLLPLCILAQQRYVVTTQKLNIRIAASANSKVVGSLRMGDIVTVYSINNGWAKIVYKNKDRYVSTKHLSKVVSDDTNQNDSYTPDSNYGQRQDIIVLKNGHSLLGKVIEVNKETIIYRPQDNTSTQSINVAAVQCIRYANGAQKNFSASSSDLGYVNEKYDGAVEYQAEQQDYIHEQFGSYGLFYNAGFEDVSMGYYGVKGDVYRPLNYWGITFAIGLNAGLVDSELIATYFALGPSAVYPINSSFYVVCPLRFVGEWYTKKDPETNKDKGKLAWGIDLVPGVLLYHKKWSFNLGFDAKWTKGNKKLGTGFMVSIGYEI